MPRSYIRSSTADGQRQPTDIRRRVDVSVPLASTRAFEMRPIALPQAQALRTCLAGVGRIDVRDSDAHLFSFVGYKVLQLPPRPPVEPGAHAFTRFDAKTDVRQVFHGNSRGAFGKGLRHNLLGRDVIDVLDVSRFTPRGLAQRLSCGLAAVALQASTSRQKPVSVVFHFIGFENLTATGRGNVHLTDINPKHISAWGRFRRFLSNSDVHEPLAALVDEAGLLGFAVFRIKHRFLALAQMPRHEDAAFQGVHREAFTFDAVSSGIKRHRSACTKFQSWPRLISTQFSRYRQLFIACCDLLKREDGHLRCRACLLAGFVVNHPLQFKFVPYFLVSSCRCDKPANLGKMRRKRPKLRFLRSTRGNFDTYTAFNAFAYTGGTTNV